MKKLLLSAALVCALGADSFESRSADIYGADGTFVTLVGASADMSSDLGSCALNLVSAVTGGQTLLGGACQKSGDGCECEAIAPSDYYTACQKEGSCKFDKKVAFSVDGDALVLDGAKLPKINSLKIFNASLTKPLKDNNQNSVNVSWLVTDGADDETLKARAQKELDDLGDGMGEDGPWGPMGAGGIETETKQTLKYADDKITSVHHFSVLSYVNGYEYEYRNFAGGKQLEQSDVFGDTAQIVAAVNKHLASDYASRVDKGEKARERDIASFAVQKGGLVVVIYRGTVSSNADGEFEVFVPYSEIQPAIKLEARRYFE